MQAVKKSPKRYRLRSISCPSLYVGGRAGSWGKMTTKKKAFRRTKKWWLCNLQPNWRDYFQLEPVGK